MKQNVMKKCFGLLLVMGLGLTLKENTAMKAQAAEEETQTNANVVVDLDFPVAGQGSVSSYTSSFEATNGDYTFTIAKANNNRNSKTWTYIAIGTKNNASTATIVSNTALKERITSIAMTFSSYKESGLDSAKIYVADNADFTDAYSQDFKNSISTTSTTTVEIPSTYSSENMFYKIEFACNGSLTSNGFIHLDQIQYIANPVDELQSLTISGETTDYVAGSTFTFNRVATAHYSNSGDKEVTSGLSFTLNGEPMKEGDIISKNFVGNNLPLVVTYTDEKKATISAAPYLVNVNYKAVSSISLNYETYTLAKNGTIALIATVEDEYANQSVTWTSSHEEIATVEDGVVTAKQVTGETTITATAMGGKTATCIVNVSVDPLLDLLDENSDVITDEVIEKYTDSTMLIKAKAQNIDQPSYLWESTNEEVVKIVATNESATLSFVGAGNCDVKVTVGSLTKKVSFSVTQSVVTSLTLTSSVENGNLYTGDNLNTLTLTPNIHTIGNATEEILWTSSHPEVASILKEQTSGNEVNQVTALQQGTTIITATSAYTSSQFVEYTITVHEDSVTRLSWTNRGEISTYAGTTLKDAIDMSQWKFTALWASGKSETPSFGTGENDVHIGLYEKSLPENEGMILSEDYQFVASDNGKYLVAFYQGMCSTSNATIEIINCRIVMETMTNATATYDFSSISKGSNRAMDVETFNNYYVSSSTLVKGKATLQAVYPDASGTIKGGTGTYNTSIQVAFGSGVEISSVSVKAKQYAEDENTLVVMGKTQTLTDTMTSYDFSVANGDFTSTNILLIETLKTAKRAYIESITIVASGEQDIGKTDDCLALEKYIDTYLHMDDYTEDQGFCKDTEHDYYGKNSTSGAKYNFNQLSERQRELFFTNAAFSEECARLQAWAIANGETIQLSNYQIQASYQNSRLNFNSVNSQSVMMVLVISLLGITSCVGYYFITKKKKEN